MPDVLALTVVIPTRNRRRLLLETLESLRRQKLDPRCFEIVVVADGCTDGTAAAVAGLAQTPAWAGRALRGVAQPWRGAAAARNTGLYAATGAVVLFLDDDCLAAPGLLAAHLAAHGDPPGDARVVLGRIMPGRARGALARELAAWWRRHYRRLAGRPADFTAVFSGNLSLPRPIALAVGGFDATMPYGEDTEFGYRLERQGVLFVYAPAALGRQRNAKGPRALLRDFVRSGQSCVRVYGKWPATLARLPLAAFGEASLRLRLGRGALLAAAENPLAARLIDWGLLAWAAGPGRQRLDRPLFELARSYYFWRGVRSLVPDRRAWRRFTSWGVPVLMYHSVAPQVPGAFDRFTQDPARFARQMRLLRWLGYRVQPLDRLAAAWTAGRLPPPRSVALTFDDGYEDTATRAWPVLQRLGYPATMFVVTGTVGADNAWDAPGERPRKAVLTWSAIAALDRAGLHAEAHSVTHPDLTAVPGAVAAVEMAESRRVLEQRLGRVVRLFAYPYGATNAPVQAQVAAAGYQVALGVRFGLNTLRTPRFDLHRIEVRGDDTLLAFALKVWSGADPARWPLPKWLLRRPPR